MKQTRWVGKATKDTKRKLFIYNINMKRPVHGKTGQLYAADVGNKLIRRKKYFGHK